MSQVVTDSAVLLTIYKTWYTSDKLENLLFRNSPLARMLKKERIGGKEYAFAAISGRGGSVSGDARVAVANGSGGRNVEFKVTPGNLFSYFTVTDKEIKGSKDKKGAYIPALVDKMFACLEAFRKTFAACLYGAGYGEVGRLQDAVSSTGAVTQFEVPWDVIYKIDIGTKFEVTDGIELDDTYIAAGPFEVTAIDGQKITVTPAVPNGGFQAGAWLQIEGGRDSNGAPNMITGLGAWIPSYFNRTGALWTSYIGTAFYGVTRSAAVERLAGTYIERDLSLTPDETRKSALMRGIKAVRAAGGIPDIIVMNDQDALDLMTELGSETTLFQAINTADKGSSNEVAMGLGRMSAMFQNSWIKNIYDDPYCPQGTAYILDSQVLKLVALTNTETPLDDDIKGNDPGSQSPEGVSAPEMNYQLSIDDHITVQPASIGANGAGAAVLISMFANVVISNPAHCAVINLDSSLYPTSEGT